MKRNGVLILECLDQADPGSEGRFLAHMFDLMGVAHQYVEVRTRHQMISLLQESPYKVIHVTTHGSIREEREKETEEFEGWWTTDKTITQNVLTRNLKDKLKNVVLVSTACKSGDSAFSQALIATCGVYRYIAPEGSPKFHNAIFFAHLFYHKYFILNIKADEIIEQYYDRYKNPHDFTIFKKKRITKASSRRAKGARG